MRVGHRTGPRPPNSLIRPLLVFGVSIVRPHHCASGLIGAGKILALPGLGVCDRVGRQWLASWRLGHGCADDPGLASGGCG